MKVNLVVKSIIMNRKLGKILLLKRCMEDPIDPGMWENSGGNMEVGETPKEAIRREIFEETGISDMKICPPVYMTFVNKKEPYLIVVYLTETNDTDVVLSDEHENSRWVDKDECKTMLEGGIKKDFLKNKIYEMSWVDESG